MGGHVKQKVKSTWEYRDIFVTPSLNGTTNARSLWPSRRSFPGVVWTYDSLAVLTSAGKDLHSLGIAQHGPLCLDAIQPTFLAIASLGYQDGGSPLLHQKVVGAPVIGCTRHARAFYLLG